MFSTFKKDYIENYIWPCLKAGAEYEGILGTSHVSSYRKGSCRYSKKRGRWRYLPMLHRQGQRPGSFVCFKALAPEMEIIVPLA